MEYILRTHNLKKIYKNQTAVDNININLCGGDIYGFLGQNGAGKTTTIRMIMGLVSPTSGMIELFGEEMNKNKHNLFERIGSIIEFPGFYPNLTAAQNLEIQRRLMGMPDKECIEESLDTVGLIENRNKKVRDFSLGMKQRLGIARSLLQSPELLILDEPTTGLDPVGIKELRQLILKLSHERNITVLISSHILSEIEQLATKIGIIHKGKLLEEIDYSSLQNKNRHYIELKTNNDRNVCLILEQKLNISDYVISEKGVVKIYEKVNASDEIIKTIVLNEGNIKEVIIMQDSLEDYFLHLTGGELNV